MAPRLLIEYLHPMAKSEVASKVEVRNINAPGYVTKVDKVKYDDMKKAMLKALPKRGPGLTQQEIRDAVLPHLSKEVFSGGEKVGWWAKCVQLDLEAGGTIIRNAKAKPLRWTRD
jgi:hypothetical protein